LRRTAGHSATGAATDAWRHVCPEIHGAFLAWHPWSTQQVKSAPPFPSAVEVGELVVRRQEVDVHENLVRALPADLAQVVGASRVREVTVVALLGATAKQATELARSLCG